MKPKILILTFSFFFFPNATIRPAFGSDIFPFVEKHDLDSGSFRGYSTLSVENPTVQSGKSFPIDIRFFNNSGGSYFYNPFFDGLIPLPAQLAIYDSQKIYLGDLIADEGGSQKVGSEDEWIYIPSLCYVGMKAKVSTSHLWIVSKTNSIPNVPPGEYYVQLIFYKGFVSANPAPMLFSTSQDRRRWLLDFYKNFDRTELFRSNPVKITITK